MMNEEAKQVPFAFFGTPYVARDTLAMLIESGYVPRVVVTSPDAKKGRGLKEMPCATREYAAAQGIPVLTPEKLDQVFIEELSAYQCQYALVVAYGKLLPQGVLDSFPLGILNIHYSLLPKYRGAAPVEYALRAGDTETGVSIQRMILAMDAGDIVAQRILPIQESETIRELRPRLIEAGSQLLIETLPSFITGTAPYTPQNEAEVSFAPKIPKEAGQLSLQDDPLENWRAYRAYLESPGTFFYAEKDGKRIRIKIKAAHLENGAFVIDRIVPEGKPEQDFSWIAQNDWHPS